MKKARFLIVILILAIFHANVLAVDTLDSLASIKENTDKAQDLSIDQIRDTYLQKEWTSIIQKNEKLNDFITKMNPVFKFLFGYEFSVSSAFFTAFLIWLIIFAVFYQTSKPLTNNTISSILIAVATAAIITHFVSEKIIGKMS